MMKLKRKHVEDMPGLYIHKYPNAEGGKTKVYYGRIKPKNGGGRIEFALGSDERKAVDHWTEIRIANRRSEDLSRFKPEKKRVARAKPENKVMTFAQWANEYPLQQEVKDKRSLDADLGMIRLHLEPFFGMTPLTGISRKRLIEYIDARETERTIRNRKASKKPVSRGTISNELSLLRHMLNVYNREHDEKVIVPSFDGLIKRVARAGRALDLEERKKLLAVYPKWLARLAEFATETCLSEGDILRLTEAMIDRANRVIVPDGGRMKIQGKTDGQPKQMAPLTDRALEIIEEIFAGRRKSKVPIIGPLFTREDGRRITRDMISRGVRAGCKATKVRKFVFHNYRNTALTDWADRGISADVAMQAAGHTSVQMHKRYLNLQRHHIANAFGLKKVVTKSGDQDSVKQDSSVASS